MAAVYSPEKLTYPAPGRPSTIPAAPKLRDSCHACAASKVKCNKEKPTCGRCAKRGLTCEYCVTKRAGRRHDTQPSDSRKVTQASRVSSSYSSSETGILTSPNLIHSSPWQHPSNHSEVLPNLLSPTDSASLSMLTTLSTDFDDFFALPISSPGSDSFTPKIRSQPHIDFAGISSSSLDSNGAAALFIPEDAFSVIDETAADFSTLFEPRSPPNSRASSSGDAQSFQDFRSESRCCCLIRALGLFEQLFPNASTTCTSSRNQGFENVTCCQLPTMRSIVAENEQTIETINSMLQCPCSQDCYLLAIMSLMVFKILDSYAAAARETPATDGSQRTTKSHRNLQRHSSYYSKQVLQFPTVVGSYCIDGDDQGRMAAQSILGELHRVQRLVNLLSERLTGHGRRNGEVGTPSSAGSDQDTVPEGQRTPPFFNPMLDQLEADLRNRLRALSLEIIDMLRRG